MSIVRPELKRLHSPDIYDLANFDVGVNEPFGILIQSMFGPKGVDSEESFDFIACNTSWIEQRIGLGLFNGRHHLIMIQFNLEEIKDYLTAAANQISCSTWDEVAEKLSRIGKWEFEDYVQN